MTEKSKEINLVYNKIDDKYYLYYGEDYLADTNYQSYALELFIFYINKLSKID